MGAANRLTQTNRKFVFIQQTKMRKNAVTESSHILGHQRWGNEQLQLNVAAACGDLNHEIMYNNSGVICVFTDKRY